MRFREEVSGVCGNCGAIVVGVGVLGKRVGAWTRKGWEGSIVRFDIVVAELGRAWAMLMERGVSGEDGSW